MHRNGEFHPSAVFETPSRNEDWDWGNVGMGTTEEEKEKEDGYFCVLLYCWVLVHMSEVVDM